jgi:hypothetical protein
MVKFRLHDSLFSLIPRFFELESVDIIIDILDTLTILWKRLSSIGILSSLSSTQLDSLFLIDCPLSPVFSVPFARLMFSFLAFGSLGASERSRVISSLHTIFYKSFRIHPEDIGPDTDKALGQLADIFIFMNRSGRLPDRFVLSPSYPFRGLSHAIHLLSPATAARVLVFYDEYSQTCEDSIVRELLGELNCETLIQFLTMDDDSLTEAALNILSLMIEHSCIEPDNIFGFLIPAMMGTIVESIVEDTFDLKHAAIRFVHAIVVKFGWLVLPDDTFPLFISTLMDHATDETSDMSIWFLELLLIALCTPVAEFCDQVKVLCDELNVWEFLEDFPRDTGVVYRLLLKIEYELRDHE